MATPAHVRRTLHAYRLRGLALTFPAIGAHLGVTPQYARQLASIGARVARARGGAAQAAASLDDEGDNTDG